MVDVSAKRGRCEAVAAGDAAITPSPPCAACGTTAGRPASKGTRPARRDVEPFGFPRGSLACQACFQRLKHRADRRKALRRCDGCGTRGGYRRPADLLPMRYASDRFDGAFGEPGSQWCHECVVADPAAAQAVFGGRGCDTAWAPKREEIIRQAAEIAAAREGRCRKAEARRLAAAVAASRWITPAAGARLARREYWGTFIGKETRRNRHIHKELC